MLATERQQSGWGGCVCFSILVLPANSIHARLLGGNLEGRGRNLCTDSITSFESAQDGRQGNASSQFTVEFIH